MIESKMREAYRMAELFETSPAIKALITTFAQTFFQMAHSEGYDPRTVVFDGFSPQGEPDKLVMVLQRADYLKEPITEMPARVQSASYQLVRHMRSFYASFLASNDWVAGFTELCPGFCDCIYMLMGYVVQRYTEAHKVLKNFAIDCGDSAANDLVFYIYLV